MSISKKNTDHSILFRRSLFVAVLLLVTFCQIFLFFRGLNTPQAMDIAQIAREEARGNGQVTKFIRPAAYNIAQKANPDVSLEKFADTYQAPLYPKLVSFVFKAIQVDNSTKWAIQKNQYIYPLDRVVAGISTFFFLTAIALSYLLITRIFDSKIAGVTCILMLTSQTLWSYAVSGLPQMFLLSLFLTGSYFAFLATEKSGSKENSLLYGLLAAGFFILMALTHWLALWIVFAYIIYSSLAIRPKGLVSIGTIILTTIACLQPALRNNKLTDSPLGSAFFVVYRGLNQSTEGSIMRIVDTDAVSPEITNIITSVCTNTVNQIQNIIPFLGGIFVALLFFFALIHPLKRNALNQFQWGTMLMWIFATFGMTLFGVTAYSRWGVALEPNQFHLLFIPIMTAYGLVMLTLFWNKLEVVQQNRFLKNIHLILIIALCGAPMALSFPNQIKSGLARKGSGIPWWPPYIAPALAGNSSLATLIEPNQIIFSDQPWAVAWYTDRTAIWIPQDLASVQKLQKIAEHQNQPPAGILISPLTSTEENLYNIISSNPDIYGLFLDGAIMRATTYNGKALNILENSPSLDELRRTYPYRVPISGYDMIFYSRREPQVRK